MLDMCVVGSEKAIPYPLGINLQPYGKPLRVNVHDAGFFCCIFFMASEAQEALVKKDNESHFDVQQMVTILFEYQIMSSLHYLKLIICE